MDWGESNQWHHGHQPDHAGPDIDDSTGDDAGPDTRTAATPADVSAPGAMAPAAATSSAGGSLDTLLTYLSAQVGTPYRFYSAGPATFDCSGLVVAAFRQIGMSMPHQSLSLARLGTPAVNDPTLITHVGVPSIPIAGSMPSMSVAP